MGPASPRRRGMVLLEAVRCLIRGGAQALAAVWDEGDLLYTGHYREETMQVELLVLNAEKHLMYHSLFTWTEPFDPTPVDSSDAGGIAKRRWHVNPQDS